MVLSDSREATLDGMGASTDLANGLAIENAEIRTEFDAWRRVYEEDHSNMGGCLAPRTP